MKTPKEESNRVSVWNLKTPFTTGLPIKTGHALRTLADQLGISPAELGRRYIVDGVKRTISTGWQAPK